MSNLLKIIFEKIALSGLSKGSFLLNIQNALIYNTRHCFLYAFPSHSWSFKKLYSIFIRFLLTFFLWYFSILLKIFFVCNQYLFDSYWCMFIYGLHPVLNWLQRFFVCYVIHDYYSVSFLVKCCSHCSKPVLSSSVPNLYLIFSLILFVFFCYKV